LDTAEAVIAQPVRFTFGKQRFVLHISLFLVTFFTTTLAGVAWRGENAFELANFNLGLQYSTLLLLFLTAHEMGHFIMARIRGVEATLPYYIPLPGILFGAMAGFGTLGAVIRTKSRIPSRKVIFDIGVAGPIAGFIVCCFILAVGFLTLPGIEYLQAIHPGYPHPQGILAQGGPDLVFGKTLLYSLFEKIFARSGGYIPPMSEMYHYPMLCVGWFGLFVTSLNLLPVGQLDGGHLIYGLASKKTHKLIGKLTALALLLISIPSTVVEIGQTGAFHVPGWLKAVVVPGGETWLLWAIMISIFIRFGHPETLDESPLDSRRKIVAYSTVAIFILCFTPTPLLIAN
jgi:membrane-associated protease RseP (regulator of RpoE activity)